MNRNDFGSSTAQACFVQAHLFAVTSPEMAGYVDRINWPVAVSMKLFKKYMPTLLLEEVIENLMSRNIIAPRGMDSSDENDLGVYLTEHILTTLCAEGVVNPQWAHRLGAYPAPVIGVAYADAANELRINMERKQALYKEIEQSVDEEISGIYSEPEKITDTVGADSCASIDDHSIH